MGVSVCPSGDHRGLEAAEHPCSRLRGPDRVSGNSRAVNCSGEGGPLTWSQGSPQGPAAAERQVLTVVRTPQPAAQMCGASPRPCRAGFAFVVDNMTPLLLQALMAPWGTRSPVHPGPPGWGAPRGLHGSHRVGLLESRKRGLPTHHCPSDLAPIAPERPSVGFPERSVCKY